MGLPPEEYTPVATPLASTILVIQDGCDPTGANLSIAEKALANGMRDLQNRVAPLAGSGNLQRIDARLVWGTETVLLDTGEPIPYFVPSGAGSPVVLEIFPPHGSLLREVVLRLRANEATTLKIWRVDLFTAVDLGGDIDEVPNVEELATSGVDSGASATAVRSITATLAGSGHSVDRQVNRYLAAITATSGVNSMYFGLRRETRIPAGGAIDPGAG